MDKNNELARLLELFSALLPLSKTEREEYLALHPTVLTTADQTMQMLESEHEDTELPSINQMFGSSPVMANEIAEAGEAA
jgi:hypothetical protein